MLEAVQDALGYIRKHYNDTPEIGIILGTGLGNLAARIEEEKALAYNFIPHFPISTVESHFGKLIFGTLGGKKVVAMQGRFHYYEGYTMQEITFPVRVMNRLGIHTLIVSNASGALNLNYKNGDLVVIDDHINLMGNNPLIGPNDRSFGPRFPDMSRPYDPSLIEKAQEIAHNNDITLHKGVYVGVIGPNLETRAEYRYLERIGGDVVGMSTVPEVLVARHMDMQVFAVSVVTDVGDPENLHPVSLDDVISVASAAEPKLTRLVSELIPHL